MIWLWDKFRLVLAMAILFIALLFAGISALFHWCSVKIEDLANRIY